MPILRRRRRQGLKIGYCKCLHVDEKEETACTKQDTESEPVGKMMSTGTKDGLYLVVGGEGALTVWIQNGSGFRTGAN